MIFTDSGPALTDLYGISVRYQCVYCIVSESCDETTRFSYIYFTDYVIFLCINTFKIKIVYFKGELKNIKKFDKNSVVFSRNFSISRWTSIGFLWTEAAEKLFVIWKTYMYPLYTSSQKLKPWFCPLSGWVCLNKCSLWAWAELKAILTWM